MLPWVSTSIESIRKNSPCSSRTYVLIAVFRVLGTELLLSDCSMQTEVVPLVYL